MRFRGLILKLHLPQYFCHSHTNTQIDIFQKQSNLVQVTPSVNPWKTKVENLHEINTFLYLQKGSKNI